MNVVILCGRMTHDPELKQAGQTSMTSFRLAVDREIKREGQPDADFIRVVVFGRQAENTVQYCPKGRQVNVVGRLQTGSYTNKEGKTIYTTDVIADRVEFLGSAKTDAKDSAPEGFTEYLGDVPF